MSTETATRRLHWGSGRSVAPGWINADRVDHGDVDVVGDIREGLPIESLFTHVLWCGHSRTLFTADFAEELLRGAGFARIEHVAEGATASTFLEIVALDDRAQESLFVEAFA